MAEQNNNPIICRNGHPQNNPDSRFCIYCGVALSVQPSQPVAPVQPQINNHSVLSQNPPVQQSPVQNYQPQQNYQVPPPPFISVCQTCGGQGKNLEEKVLVCKGCKWLRPLVTGYAIDCAAFQWAEDGKAMAVLRSISPLNSLAEMISNKVGSRWIEVTFNGVKLSEKQMPHIYGQSVKAARILGMSYMPDIYVSGEMFWDCRTYGSDTDSFVVLGTAIASNFRDDELLFLFAREMGHCRTGHALWKTVIKFLMGEQGPRKGLLGRGIFSALSPSALIGGAIETPLLAWARQAEITADRAGMLAVGEEELARRVLLSWSLKSPFLYRQINVEAWLEQQESSDVDEMSRLSELTTSSTPYITRRLKLLNQFATGEHLKRWRDVISSYLPKDAPPPNQAKKSPASNNDLKIKCSACATPMVVPAKILAGKSQVNIRCPKPECKKITTVKKQVKPPPSGNTPAKKETKLERNNNYGE